jgi:hypothetical protein
MYFESFQTLIITRFVSIMVPKAGFEPARPYGHCALNTARLPVPPLRHVVILIIKDFWRSVKGLFSNFFLAGTAFFAKKIPAGVSHAITGGDVFIRPLQNRSRFLP